MTADVANDHHRPRIDRVSAAPTRSLSRPAFGIRTGQFVATQAALVLLVAGAAAGTVTFAASAFLVVVLLAVTWLRLDGRWAFEWLAVAVRYWGSRRTSQGPLSPTALLEFALPGARIDRVDLPSARATSTDPPAARIDRADQPGDSAAVIVSARGLAIVLELGDPTGLLADETYALPSLAAFLPPPEAEHPPCRIQLVLSGVPAPHTQALNDTSYRQLTDGQVLGHTRALLAVRVDYADGWSTADLVRSLSTLSRKIRRRLDDVPVRPLGTATALQTIAELAHADARADAVERWPALRVGHTTQATFRLRRRSGVRGEPSPHLVTHLLSLPAAATTVATTAERPDPARVHDLASAHNFPHQRASSAQATLIDVTVRIVASDAAGLANATRALHRLVRDEDVYARRLDGEHLTGLTATLPLGAGVPVRPSTAILDRLDLTIGTAGVVVGRNRTGDPVTIRLFRPEQTRVLLVGGVRAAQVLTFRAMAVGARIVVQTARPQAWERFVSGAAGPGAGIAVVSPGHPVQVPAGTARQPLLVVVDVGPVGADAQAAPGWQATLVVRDDFGPADADVAARADLLVLQQLRADEAELVGTAVGLGRTAELLTRIRPDMVGLVNRRAVRWAALAQTPIEAHLIGPPTRE